MSTVHRFLRLGVLFIALAPLLLPACIMVRPAGSGGGSGQSSASSRPPRAARHGYTWQYDDLKGAWVEVPLPDEPAEGRPPVDDRRTAAWERASRVVTARPSQLLGNPSFYHGRQVSVGLRGTLLFKSLAGGKQRALLFWEGGSVFILQAFSRTGSGPRAAQRFREAYNVEPLWFDANVGKRYARAGSFTLRGVVTGSGVFTQRDRRGTRRYRSVTIQLTGRTLPRPRVEPKPEPKPAPKVAPLEPLRLVKHYLSPSDQQGKVRPRSTTVRQGEKFHFYFEMANARILPGNGAPLELRLLVLREGKRFLALGPHAFNAWKGAPARQARYAPTYWNAAYTFNVGKSGKPGRYTATITVRDKNTNRTLTVPYAFTVVAAPAPKPPPPAVKKLKVLSAYLTRSNKKGKMAPWRGAVAPGDTIYVYFKVANVKFVRGRGCSLKVHLRLTQKGRVVKDLGWFPLNTHAKLPIASRILDFYENASLSLAMGRNLAPGAYRVLATVQDAATGQSVNLSLTVQVRRDGKPAEPRPVPVGRLKVVSAFWTESQKAAGAVSLQGRVPKGRKVYTCLKLADLRYARGKGAVVRTRLEVKNGPRTIKDFGWRTTTLVPPRGADPDRNLLYATTLWSLTPGMNMMMGNYTAVVTVVDVNTGQTVKATLPFKLVDPIAAHKPRPGPKARTVWKLVKVDAYRKTPEGDEHRVEFTAKPGKIVISRELNRKKKREKDFVLIAEELRYAPPPARLKPGSALQLAAKASRLKKKGRGKAEGLFLADATLNPRLAPGASWDIPIGRNRGGRPDRESFYDWVRHARRFVVPAGGPGKEVLRIRIGFKTKRCTYFAIYLYRWSKE